MKLFDGGALFLFLWISLFGYVQSLNYASVPGDVECVGVACDADRAGPAFDAPVVDDPVDSDEDEDEDDGNNGHGNDDDHDDDSNPGKG